MPDAAILFIFGILGQVLTAFLVKEPEFLKDIEDSLEIKNKTNNLWKINDETALRDLSIHQIIKHLRSFYGQLIFLKYLFYFLVSVATISSIFYMVLGISQNVNSAVYSFLIIYISFSLFMFLLSAFCFMFSWLIKSKPQS